MRRRQLLAAVPLAFAATAAQAAGGGEESKAEPYVNLSPIALPVAVNGKLINYVFVQLRLHLAPYCFPAQNNQAKHACMHPHAVGCTTRVA